MELCDRCRGEFEHFYELAKAKGYRDGYMEGLSLFTKEIAAVNVMRPVVITMPRKEEVMKNFITDESGQDLVEYALLLVFIALIVIAALPHLGQTVSNVFSNAASALNSKAGS